MYPRFSLLIPAHTLVVHKLWEAGSNLKAVNSNRSPSALSSFFLVGFFLISVCCVLFCFAITEALTKHSVFFVSFQLSLLISHQNLAFEWIWKATRELTHGWEPCLSYLVFVIAESFEKKKRKKHHPVSCFSDVYNVRVGSWIAASLMQQFVNITLSLSQRFMSE